MGKRGSMLPALGVLGLLGVVGYLGYMGSMKGKEETKEGFRASTGTTIGMVVGGIVVLLLGLYLIVANSGSMGSVGVGELGAMLVIGGVGIIAAPFTFLR